MRRSVRRPPVTAETLMLTAIHTWAARGAPRLRRLVPERGNEGDPIVLEGEGFGSGELTVSFGDLTTWAVALSDEARGPDRPQRRRDRGVQGHTGRGPPLSAR